MLPCVAAEAMAARRVMATAPVAEAVWLELAWSPAMRAAASAVRPVEVPQGTVGAGMTVGWLFVKTAVPEGTLVPVSVQLV